jgi:hypothetical protein
VGIPPTLDAFRRIWFQLQARGVAQRFVGKQDSNTLQLCWITIQSTLVRVKEAEVMTEHKDQGVHVGAVDRVADNRINLAWVGNSPTARMRWASHQFRIGTGDISMQQYDLYLNPQKPAAGLYVRKGAGLPDLADPREWVFDGTAAQAELPPDLVKKIEANGHAFRDMD